jgi:DNA-binding transcriptional MerR regulator
MTAAPVRFDDGKAPDALRTIGELSRALGIRQHVLRYWEDQFPQLQPLKRSGGRRHYRPEDVALVATIDRLVHQEGYTLKGARMALEGAGAERVAAAVTLAPQSGEVLHTLTAIARDLRAALLAA